jgi:hypothetical protein
MKIMIVAEDRETVARLKSIFAFRGGGETFVYPLILKALDNLDEIAPDAVCLSARDFPRHWQLFLRYLSSPVVNPHPRVVLLTGPLFEEEDARDAQFLGVTHLIDEGALAAGTFPDDFLPDEPRTLPEDSGIFDPGECLFVDPLTGNLVTGTVEGRTGSSLRFRPDFVPPGYFIPGSLISHASVKIGEELLSPQFQVAATDAALELRLC